MVSKHTSILTKLGCCSEEHIQLKCMSLWVKTEKFRRKVEQKLYGHTAINIHFIVHLHFLCVKDKFNCRRRQWV